MQYSLLRFDELQHLYTHLNHVSVTHKFGKFTEKKVILFFQGFEFVLGKPSYEEDDPLRVRGCSKDKEC